MKNNTALFTSDSQDWYTPKYVFKKIEKITNTKFDYDPCGSINSPTSKIIPLVNDINNGGQDGLNTDWNNKNIFINPPFGKEISKWVKKAYETSLNNPDKKIVMLIPARTDTKYFHDYIFNKADIYFIKGRIRFCDITGKSVLPAPFPSTIVIFGGNKIESIIIEKGEE